LPGDPAILGTEVVQIGLMADGTAQVCLRDW
jgi:hypothetical protein